MRLSGKECKLEGRKQYCVKGHNTWVCGRFVEKGKYKKSGCWQCKKDYTKKWKKTEAGRACKRREWNTESAKARGRKFQRSTKGRILRRIYSQTDNYKKKKSESMKRYRSRHGNPQSTHFGSRTGYWGTAKYWRNQWRNSL